MLHVWERIVPEIQHSNTYTCILRIRTSSVRPSYNSYTCATPTKGNALTAKTKVFVPSLSNYLGHVDQSASLLVSESAIHPTARVWQQAFPEVEARKSPKHLVESRESGVHPNRRSYGQSIEESTISEPQTRPSTQTPLGVTDADSDEASATGTTHFSASLADGTIVHLKNSFINLSHFKGLVLTISKIWKQHSDKIIPQLFAQNVGIAISSGVHNHRDFGQDVLSTTIYDAGVGRGSRKIFSYTRSVSADRSQFSCLHFTDRSNERWAGRSNIRSALVKALKNYIGSVDQHDRWRCSLHLCHMPPVLNSSSMKGVSLMTLHPRTKLNPCR